MRDRPRTGFRFRITAAVALIAAVAVAAIGLAATRVVQTSAERELRGITEAAVADGLVDRTHSAATASGPPLIVDSREGDPGNDVGSFTEVPGAIIVAGTGSGGVTAVGASGPDGAVELTAFTPTGGLDEAVTTLESLFWFGGPVLVVVLTLAAWLLTGRALRPVGRIVDEANTITASNLDRRIPPPGGGDEIAKLVDTVNRMLDRIEGGAERQRRFVSDASHELRSPLTALLGELQIALAHPESSPWSDSAERALTQGHRLDVLVGNLLEVAAEAESGGGNVESIDLADLIAREVEDLHDVELDLDSVTVAGVPADLTSVVRNLVSNASRHTESVTKVGLRGLDDRVVITVDDDGPGVAIEHREEIFERFARLDEARSRDAGGAGLGLSIVRTVVERHGGTVVVGSNPMGGARFTVDLPADPKSC